MKYQEVEGDLIDLALKGSFDVIAHGCNCQCTMKSGIAIRMAEVFSCDKFTLEHNNFKGDINKLGQIEWRNYSINNNKPNMLRFPSMENKIDLFVINCYTQFMYGKNHIDGLTKPIDYEALILCMRKINFEFKDKHIGLPMIGAGLAGGDWEKIKEIIKKELYDCNITIVIFKQ